MKHATKKKRPNSKARHGDQSGKGVVVWAARIFALALGVRFAHILLILRAPFFPLKMGDAIVYDQWAREIAGGQWLGDEVFYLAPLYQYFLAIVYLTVGQSMLMVRLVHALIGSLACVFLLAAGWRLFSKQVGILAGVLLALYAPAIYFDTVMQKSALDLFFLTLALWFIACLIDEPRYLHWCGLGLTLGGLVLTRENAQVLVLVIVVWSLVYFRSSGWRRIVFAGLFLVSTAAVLVPVALRNKFVGGEFTITKGNFGGTLYTGNNEHATGTYQAMKKYRGFVGIERQDEIEIAETDLGRKLKAEEVSDYWTQRTLNYIRSQPGSWIRLMFRKLALCFNAVEVVDTEDQYTYASWSPILWLAGLVFHFGVLAPVAALGIWLTIPQWRRLWLFYLMLAAYTASVIIFFVLARYRYPLVPMLMLFAAVAIAHAGPLLGRRTGRRRVYTFIRRMVGSVNRFVRHMVARLPFPRGEARGKVHTSWPPPRRNSSLKWEKTWKPLLVVVLVAIFCNLPLSDTNRMRSIMQYNVGVELVKLKRFEDAIEQFQVGLRFSPRYAASHNNLGSAYLEIGEYDKAIHHYLEARRIDHEYAEPLLNLGIVMIYKRDFGTAAALLEQFLREHPDDADAYFNLGIVAVQRGEFPRAKEMFEKTLRINPDYTNAQDALKALEKLQKNQSPDA